VIALTLCIAPASSIAIYARSNPVLPNLSARCCRPRSPPTSPIPGPSTRIRRFEADDGLQAALHTPAWVRTHPDQARLLLLYDRKDFLHGKCRQNCTDVSSK
jgi:hypothetical protein